MPIYTVHAPPAEGRGASAPERYAFVRDGFYFWAFIFGPLWMVFRRLWLVLLGYIVVMAALLAIMWLADIRAAAGPWPLLLAGILLGLEAGTLRRWTLARRGWRDAGIVVADNLEQAERRFFDRWTETGPAPRISPAVPVPPRPQTPSPPPEPGVIGLFPEPGAPR